MSPRVDRGELGSIEVSIKTSEHGNPHVHGWYQGNKVKIFIETLGIESGGLPRQQMTILMNWIRANEDYLLAEWEEITGLPVRR